jgi:hypothetical protein
MKDENLINKKELEGWNTWSIFLLNIQTCLI